MLKNRLPHHAPSLSALLDDLGRPTAKDVGEMLDVNQRTVRRWIFAGIAPRPVMLALFWMTRWGRSALECEAHNDVTLWVAVARCLADENEKLAGRINHLTSIAEFGSANGPLPDVITADPVRMALKAFLENPPHRAPPDEHARDQAAPSTGSATTEETQQPCHLRHG
jgi:hypothetical protein